jgi:hypothetical protein
MYQKEKYIMAFNLTSVTSAVGAIGGGVQGFRNVSRALGGLGDLTSAEGLGSAIRMGLDNLPAAGETIGDIIGAVSEFTDPTYENDWRVRLSMAKWTSFKSSPVLTPLKEAGGLIFPYTPTINIHGGATYNAMATTHSNYPLNAYKNSDPGAIKIEAPMFVEDPSQGLYWIAMVHYLRSLTKMFSGADSKAGNPPPIIFLNGYGNYVFKNVPVVVTSMDVRLDSKSDYIGVNVVGSAAGGVQSAADQIGGLSDSLGGLGSQIGGGFGSFIGQATSIVSGIAGGVGSVAGTLGSLGVGGSISGGVTHVPTKSTFSVTLMPMYSRDSVRKFSLDRFVTGGYLNSSFGYI